MRFLTVCCAAALFAGAKDRTFDLVGRIDPPGPASIAISGAITPFSGTALSDSAGRFRFRRLAAGTYTLAVVVSGRGETRTTIEVGPGDADAKGRVVVILPLKGSEFSPHDEHSVSATELSIPDRAWRAYEAARRQLSRRDADAAASQLEKCVGIAPQFAAAWNLLGTIAYQTQRYEKAEQDFREALRRDPKSYEALVNLGGVSINLRKLDQAREYNTRAVALRPGDALANSQLGMTYFSLGNLAQAETYLTRAVEIDPVHFSHPQLLLAEIHTGRGDFRSAAGDLEGFLIHHPDWPKAAELRATIAALRAKNND